MGCCILLLSCGLLVAEITYRLDLCYTKVLPGNSGSKQAEATALVQATDRLQGNL